MWQQPFALRHFNPVYVGLGSKPVMLGATKCCPVWPPKLDIAARITSMSANRGAATVRVRFSISYVDGPRAVHRGHSRRITRQKE
jgi:hypothetical protein